MNVEIKKTPYYAQKVLLNKLRIKSLDKKIEEEISFFGSPSAWGLEIIHQRDEIWRWLHKNEKEWIEENYDPDNHKRIKIF